MNFKDLINENLVVLNSNATTKEEVITLLIEKLHKEGAISSEKDFFNAVMAREAQSPTGLEEGLAIPHGKADCVITPKIAVARLNNTIDTWESTDDDNKVNLVFLIAIPTAKSGTTHIEVLSKLTTAFMKDKFIEKLQTSKTTNELLEVLYEATQDEEKKSNEIIQGKQTVLAITACATGIAHTYLAAEALQKAATELGINIIVEKQGANGIENRLTPELIKKADAIIFATDISAKETERFAGKKYIQTRVAAPIKDAKGVITKALDSKDVFVATESSSSDSSKNNGENLGVLQEIKRAFLTGISYMIPLVIAGAVIMGIARIGGSIFNVSDIWDGAHAESANAFVRIFNTMDGIGGRALGFMLPFIAGFVAFALSDRVALVPGFIGGALAKELNTGFLGALIAGIIAGYAVRFVMKKFKFSGIISGMTSILIAPVLGTLITALLMIFVIGGPLGGLNKALEVWLMNMSGSNQILLAAIIGAMVGFDLGGPINKAAVTTAMALLASGITIPNTAAQVAIIVPPIGLGIATILGKNKYDKTLQEAGKSSILMGLVGISEGAIPFAIESPLKVIPVNVIGSALASALAVALGANNPAPISGFYGWFTVQNWPIYILAIAVGSLFIGVTTAMLRKKQ